MKTDQIKRSIYYYEWFTYSNSNELNEIKRDKSSEKIIKFLCNYSAPRLGYINFWSKQRKYNFCFIIALLRKVDNFSM